MKTTIRIAWLIAGTFLVARLGESLIDSFLWHLTGHNFRVPRAYGFPSFESCLNAAALLSVSFAIVSTCSWLIERRFVRSEEK